MFKKIIILMLLSIIFISPAILMADAEKDSSFFSRFNNLFSTENEEEESENTEKKEINIDDIDIKVEDIQIKKFNLLKTLKEHSNYVRSVSFSPDGKYLASGGGDFTIKIFSTKDWKVIKTLSNGSSTVNSISFSPDGKYLASGGRDNTVKIYSTKTWKQIQILKDFSTWIYSISFSPDGKYLATGGGDKSVKIFSTSTWKETKTLSDHHSLINLVTFSSDGKYFASSSYDSTIQIYSTLNWENIKIIKNNSQLINSITFSFDGSYFIFGNPKITNIYSISNWQPAEISKKNSGGINAIAFSPKGEYFVSANSDNTIEIYLTLNWKIQKTFKNTGVINSIAFGPNEKYFATGNADNTVNIYEIILMNPDKFTKIYVEKYINKWQLKNEFEKNSDYKKRMTYRDEIAKKVFGKAKILYSNQLAGDITNTNIKILGEYDAESETFKLEVPTMGKIFVHIPIDNAKSFKESESFLLLKNPEVEKINGKITLSTIDIYNPITRNLYPYSINSDIDYNPESFDKMDFAFKPYNYSFEKVNYEDPKTAIKKEPVNTCRLLENIPKRTEKNENAIAVVIGNTNYNQINNVEYAINDATYIKKYLIEAFGYLEENIIFVPDASQGDFIGIFGKENNHKGKLYYKVRKNESDVFVYYSGHGAPDVESKKGYFVPVDCNPATVELNGYSIDLLYENLNKIDYRNLTVVIDACFSGENTLKNVSPVYIKLDNPVINNANTVIFSSAKGNQLSTWYPEKNHSLFTYYFLKGINDFGTDVTNKQLFNYLKDEVSYMSGRLHSREQNPTFVGDENERLVR
ncbi:MAG: caspase family protein [Candidatus Marinimicrobia bacterium]|nr:caspase family protein [Candidatus Neomarinimicrobiota bacterium]